MGEKGKELEKAVVVEEEEEGRKDGSNPHIAIARRLQLRTRNVLPAGTAWLPDGQRGLASPSRAPCSS